MENIDTNQNPVQAVTTEGIILPSGPPLTPQLIPFVTPPAGLSTCTPAQLQVYANTQFEAQNIQNMTTQQQLVVPPQNHHNSTTQHVADPRQYHNVLDPNGQFQQNNMLSPKQNPPVQVIQGTQGANPFAQLCTPALPSTMGNLAPLPTTSPVFAQIPQGMDNAALAAYFSALANQNTAPNSVPLNNVVALNNGVMMTANGPQLVPSALQNQQLIFSGSLEALASANKTAPQLSGPRAYELMAVQQTRKAHPIRTDVDRMKHLKSFKQKLVGKVFKPLDWRYASNYKRLQKIPGWYSAANKEKLRLWGLRGAELFRQTLLLEIEGEMLKVKGIRDVLFQDEQNGSPIFPVVAAVRKDLKI